MLWVIANQSCSILQLAGFLQGDFFGHLTFNMGDATACAGNIAIRLHKKAQDAQKSVQVHT
jgi:hypothetical protein